MLARSASDLQTQQPSHVKGSFGGIFSLSPKNAKHSIRIDLSQTRYAEIEVNFQLSFLADNISLLISYFIMILLVGIFISIPFVGLFFAGAFVVTMIIHLPWWLISRGKVRKEFWNYIETKVQTATQFHNPRFSQNQSTPNSQNDETDMYPGSESLSGNNLSSQKICKKCQLEVPANARYCQKCGNFIG